MKDFIIIGSKTACQYQYIFPLIKEGKLWIGYTHPSNFITKEGMTEKLNGLTRWYSNVMTNWYSSIEIQKKSTLILDKSYYQNPDKYPKYDNYPAIECSRVKDIPYDYEGEIGVPITFLDGYYPQYDIIGALCDFKGNYFLKGEPIYVDNNHKNSICAVLNGKRKFCRIIIQKNDYKKKIISILAEKLLL